MADRGALEKLWAQAPGVRIPLPPHQLGRICDTERSDELALPVWFDELSGTAWMTADQRPVVVNVDVEAAPGFVPRFFES